METAVSPDEGTEILAYMMPYDADSYYYNGYQTVLLLNRNNESIDVYAVSSDTVTPVSIPGTRWRCSPGTMEAAESSRTAARPRWNLFPVRRSPILPPRKMVQT